MSFQAGNFVMYFQDDIPIHALVIQKFISYHYNKYAPNAYIICPVEESYKYIRINETKLTLVKLTVDQKLFILTSFGKNWFCNNKKLFKKALSD